jgi:hypothetical protein
MRSNIYRLTCVIALVVSLATYGFIFLGTVPAVVGAVLGFTLVVLAQFLAIAASRQPARPARSLRITSA